MPTLFATGPGQVAALAGEPGDQGLPLSVDGVQGSWFPQFTSILTEFMAALDGNYQFTHTCRDVIYAYVFGNRISQVRVAGIAFTGSCDDGFTTGIEQVLELYAENNIAARATPLQLQVGTGFAGRFTGFLTNMRAEIVRPENRLSQFALDFKVFPGG